MGVTLGGRSLQLLHSFGDFFALQRSQCLPDLLAAAWEFLRSRNTEIRTAHRRHQQNGAPQKTQ